MNVKLPKLKMKSHIDLAEPLKLLGLTDLLQKNTRDLGLMAPTDDLRLSTIKHRYVFIKAVFLISIAK